VGFFIVILVIAVLRHVNLGERNVTFTNP